MKSWRDGFIGGVQAGYNLLAGRFLYGIEGDFDWSTLAGTSGPVATPLGLLQATTNRNWVATVAARVGITSDRMLVYGKIGAGWAEGSTALNVVNGGTISTGSHTDGGVLVGGGIEYAFASNWTGKLEYNYIGLSTTRPSRLRCPLSSATHDIADAQGRGQLSSSDPGRGSRAAPRRSPGARHRSAGSASQNPIARHDQPAVSNNTNFSAGRSTARRTSSTYSPSFR